MDPIDNKRRGVNREALTIARDYGHVLPFGVCHLELNSVEICENKSKILLKIRNYYNQAACGGRSERLPRGIPSVRRGRCARNACSRSERVCPGLNSAGSKNVGGVS